MLFNSIDYFIFFPIAVFLFFLCRHKYRWFVLLAASCIFYAVFVPAYLLILFTLILIDYSSGIWIARSTGRKRKLFLLVSIIATCLILFVFKYFNFFATNINQISTLLHWNYTLPALKLILPIGLSFHTFQSLSYVIEVYKGKQQPERHLGIYALYVMFFPQLVAGPIERPQHMLHQFHERHEPEYTSVVIGLRQMLLGYFKKMVIADNLAPYVDSVYSGPAASTGNMTIVAIFFFAIQIYCDFSGYSDIAIGSARMMGFRLMDNFNFPYFSKTIGEFWHRWHISLSTWFRDYVYIPLGGSKVSTGRMYYNLFIVFLLSALWHGAGWTFIVWGMLHASYLITGKVLNPISNKINETIPMPASIKNSISTLFTFLLTSFAWIFFRASDMHNAFEVIKHISVSPASFAGDMHMLCKRVHMLSPERVPALYLALSLLVFFAIELTLYRRSDSILNGPWTRYSRWGAYYAVVAMILLFGVYDITPNFIYFQF
jgi:alginate O-acetyltransferase complex protein AlgI